MSESSVDSLSKRPAKPESRCPVPHGDDDTEPSAEKARRTIVVTGASRGIGHAIVKRFADDGWRIITCSRQPFDQVRCPWEAGPEDHVQIDLSDRTKMAGAIEAIQVTSGPITSSAGPTPAATSARCSPLVACGRLTA